MKTVLGILVLAGVATAAWLIFGRGTSAAAASIRSTPLREQAEAAPGSKRFLARKPEHTGVDFRNVLLPENRYSYLTNGAGVTAGDFDGNGLPDLYFVCQDGPNRLFRQVRPWLFEDVTEAAGGLDGGDAWGTGTTFVDFDGDGDLDLYVCNLESPNLLFRNRGNGTFEEVAAQFGLDRVAASTMAAFADFDRDGDLDVYLLANRVFNPNLSPVVRSETRLPSEVTKTVAELQPRLPRGEEWNSYWDPEVQLYRFPGEFEDQLVFESGRPFYGGQADRLMRNDGDRFVDATEAAGLGRDHGMGLSATWWDVDLDGWLDLYVANDLESRDRLWRNLGNGRFEEITQKALPHVAYFGMGSDFADVDGDGRFDFMVADMASTTHFKSKWLMGSMSDHGWFLEHSRPQQVMRNSLFLNTGTERFQEAAFLAGVAATDWTWSLLFGDLDNDLRPDLFVTNGIARFDNDPDLRQRVQTLMAKGERDAALDLVRNVAPWPEPNLAFRNAGNVRFEKAGAEWGLNHNGVSHGALLVDLDRDGDLDVVTNNFAEPASLLENQTTTRGVLLRLDEGEGNRFGVGARVTLETNRATQVRLNVPSRGYLSGQESIVHFGVADADEIRKLTVHWARGGLSTFEHLPVGQFLEIDAGGDAERAAAPDRSAPATLLESVTQSSGAGGVVHQEREFDDFGQQPLLPWRLSRMGPALAGADVDGDGTTDWFVGGAAGQPATLLLTQPDGTFVTTRKPFERYSEGEDVDAVFFDANADGAPDLYVARGSSEIPDGALQQQDLLFFNQGNGQFRAARDVLPPWPHPANAVACEDMDGDGDIDLVVGGFAVPGRYPEFVASRVLRNEGGRFVDATGTLAPGLEKAGLVTDLAFAALDSGSPRALVVTAWWRSPTVWRPSNRIYRESVLIDQDLRGWWNTVCPVDADGDGDLDLVLGNFGTNHKYKADSTHPTTLLCADFDGDGTADLVESKFEGDRLLPVRGRSCSSAAMPFVAQKFPTYEEFARSSLTEIYGTEEVGKANRLEATELRHVILWNDGEGFRVAPLPRRTQLAPVFGIAGFDLAGNGSMDLVLNGNFHAPEPETGRMDGGIGAALRWNGSELEWLSPAETGLVLEGDGRRAVADENRLLFTASDGPLSVYARRPGGS